VSARTYPYRMVTDQVVVGPWTSDTGAPLGDFLPVWDYGVTLRCSRTVRLDLPQVRNQCGLPEWAPLAINVRYWPTTSLLRRTACHLSLVSTENAGEIERLIEIAVAGDGLAGSIEIETTLVLAGSVDEGEPFIARRPGSILWREQRSVRLEGNSGLLPVAPVSFKQQGLPEQAAWYVSVDSAEWGSAAMGNLIVLLNDDNARVRAALETPDEPGTALMWDALMVDVVCDLVGRAIEDEEFTSWPTEPGDGTDREPTTAALVHRMIRGFLMQPNEGLHEAIERLRDERRRDPSRLRAAAQSSLRFPKGALT
jgi:hypothetical protein